MIKIEQLHHILQNHPAIKCVKRLQSGGEQFDRTFKFEVHGQQFQIEWWSNVAYLSSIWLQSIGFDKVSLSATWPNNSRMNLQFEYQDRTIAVIPLEPRCSTEVPEVEAPEPSMISETQRRAELSRNGIG